LTTWRHPGQSNITIGTPVIGPSPTPVLPDGTRGYLIFTRNERFWGQKPQLKEVHYWLFQNPSTAWEAYKAGEGDANPAVIAQELDIAKTLKGSTFHQIPQLAFSYVTLNWKLAPFDDVRMRQAFSLALDRQAIAHDSLKDTAQPTIHFMPEGLAGYNPDLADVAGRKGKDALTPDLAMARRLANEYAAEKCGGALSQCPPVTMLVSGSTAPQKTAELMMQQWTAAFPGLSVTIRGVDRSYLPEFPLLLRSWGADYPDPQDFISLLWMTGSPHNRSYSGSKASIPQVDQLCVQADGIGDLSTRIPLYQQAEQLLVKQVAAIPYAQPLTTYVVRSRVVGWRMLSYATPLSVWQATSLTR
jgi:oligopeptide transport system substrate-binding protein